MSQPLPRDIPALPTAWKMPTPCLPAPVEDVLRRLRLRGAPRRDDALVVATLVKAFQEEGVNIQGVKRSVGDIHHGGHHKGNLRLNLAGFEIDGVVHGVHGGVDWLQLLDIERYRQVRENQSMFGQALYVQWEPVEPSSINIPVPTRYQEVVREVLALHQAKMLDDHTPSSKGVFARRRV